MGTYAREAIHALTAAGCTVRVITEAHDEAHPRVAAEGRVIVHRIPIHARPEVSARMGLLRFASEAGRLVSELAADGQIDIVEFAECEAAGAALLGLRGLGAQHPGHGDPGPEGLIAEIEGGRAGGVDLGVVVHLHTPTEQLFSLRSLRQQTLEADLATQILAERIALREADVVCAPSRFIAAWAHRRYGLRERPRVIPLPVSVRHEESGSAEKRVLFSGRIEPRKGVEPLLQAWARVVREHPGWTLALAGGDSHTAPGGGLFWEFLSERIPSDIAETIEYLGPLKPDVLERERARAALCVIPSLWENFPYTCSESLAAGRAVVVSHRGGMAEMIGDSDAGVIVRAGDPEALARGLSELLAEGVDRLLERGRAGRARISEMCDPPKIAARRIELYREAVARAAMLTFGGVEGAGPRLQAWRQAQSVAAGRLDALDIPDFASATTSWLEETEQEACA